MDVATIVGVVVGIAVMIGSIVIGGASLSAFFDLASVFCVLGGALCAVMISYPIRVVRLVPAAILRALRGQVPATQPMVEQLVSLAEIARRDGLLSLENHLPSIDDRFLKLGMQMAVDGAKPEMIAEVMHGEIAAISQRHGLAKSVLTQLGRLTPAFGMIGTLVGLVMMLNRMSDPAAIGGGMAVALLTTLYGAILANLFFIPLAEKLAFYQREEVQYLELIVKGILAIQSGQHPRVVLRRLQTGMHPSDRPTANDDVLNRNQLATQRNTDRKRIERKAA